MSLSNLRCAVLLLATMAAVELRLSVTLAASDEVAADEAVPSTAWTKVAPPLAGRRWDIPLGTAPLEGDASAVLILGGRTSWADYKKPRPYDVLRLDVAGQRWLNEFPRGMSWGPESGPCEAPAWRDERFRFEDTAGNTRPNWTVYGTFSLGQKYDFDPDTGRFYFYAGGKTFSYEPRERVWVDLNPPTHPEGELGGILLWGSMCYDRHSRRFLLFGGGNVQTPRGDPGTWAYSPSENRWTQLECEQQPPARANSRLVYDPDHKKVVLFGGDQLNQLVCDTWTFDVTTNRWTEMRPTLSPSPRAGHALLWSTELGKVVLLAGYGYTSTVEYVAALYRPLPLEAWSYDVGKNEWQLLGRWTKDAPQTPANSFVSATVSPGASPRFTLLGLDGTWQVELRSAADPRQSAKWGVAPGTVARRTGPHDPAWYREDVPAADVEQLARELRDLPANQWLRRSTPKRPGPNMDWGSAVFSPELDQIIRFSGGHSAYSGTAPQVYDVKTDRYSIPFAPELPIEFVYSNDQVHGEWSFQGNPWMTGHTYRSTGYDPRLRSLVFAPHEYTYFFDSTVGRWSRGSERNPYRADFYNVTVCTTPQGAVVWADRREGGGAGLWQLHAESRRWEPLPLNGTLPQKSPDQHGLAYDSHRDRLLFFSNVGPRRGDVMSYDRKTGDTRWLEPTGKSHGAVPSRETIYLPEHDLVLVGARRSLADRSIWLAYDGRDNRWCGIELTGDDPLGAPAANRVFNNSMGLMFDPQRKLVWAVGQHSHMHVLRFDASKKLPLDD